MKFVIMAGGTGSKLWPISRAKDPKQFIKIVGEKTLFQLTVESLLKRYTVQDIFVSTTEDLVHFVEDQTPNIPKENYIIEPMARDTGPASCFAMAKVAAKYPDEVVYFYVQAVCTREPAEKFLDMIEEMEKLVNKEGKLVTGTILPKYIETGSDLMKLGDKQELGKGMNAYQIKEFINVVKERMTMEQVGEIARNNTVGTHTNHLTWKPKLFFEAVKKYRPDWLAVVEELKAVFGKENEKELVAEIYAKFEKGRVELMTTELIKDGLMMAVELPFDWAHITTWDDVYRYRRSRGLPEIEGKVMELESNENLVLSNGKKLIVLAGMNEMVVVETDDAIYISPRSKSNKVKDVTDKLAETNPELL
ncbi:MAG: sugar phosphate nucleotidyltransferase [Candidatus Shapirobacteria bacterium]|jgi:mannose-1-phosphate guanylyltransferase